MGSNADRIDPAAATFQALIGRASDPIFVTEGTCVRYANPALLAMLGYESAELVGRDAAFVHADGLRRRDGTIALVELVMTPVDFAGVPAQLVSGRAVSAARRPDLTVATIAHDFNNVLAVILSSVDFAIEDLGPAHAVVTDLREIEAAAQRATKLAKHLLAASRTRPKSSRPTSATFSRDRLRGAIRLAQPEAREDSEPLRIAR